MNSPARMACRVWLLSVVSFAVLMAYLVAKQQVYVGRPPVAFTLALRAVVVFGVAGCSFWSYATFCRACARLQRERWSARMLTSRLGDRILWCSVVSLCVSGAALVASGHHRGYIPIGVACAWTVLAGIVYPLFLKRLVEWASELAGSATERPTEALTGSC